LQLLKNSIINEKIILIYTSSYIITKNESWVVLELFITSVMIVIANHYLQSFLYCKALGTFPVVLCV